MDTKGYWGWQSDLESRQVEVKPAGIDDIRALWTEARLVGDKKMAILCYQALETDTGQEAWSELVKVIEERRLAPSKPIYHNDDL